MINITTEQNRMTVHFPPRLDTVHCLQWQEDLLAQIEQHQGSVVFDLADVTFLASVFLRICMQVVKKVGATQFRIVGLTPDIKKVFKVAGLDGQFIIE